MVHLLRAVGVREPGDIAGQPDLLSQAAALARKLAAANTTVSQTNLIGGCLDGNKDTETVCLTK
jgi:uncharacterized protein (DUF1810 family)